METDYRPEIPVVMVHPFYIFPDVPELNLNLMPKVGLWTDECVTEKPAYVDNIIDLIENHQKELIVLEEAHKVTRTRKFIEQVRKGDSVMFIETKYCNPEPVSGWDVLFDKLKEINASEVGLVGGINCRFVKWFEKEGCLGVTRKRLSEQGYTPQIIRGHFFDMHEETKRWRYG
ncbi:MAG: hypothetical protein AABX11_02290 [Nanoarchaeota archaeon]